MNNLPQGIKYDTPYEKIFRIIEDEFTEETGYVIKGENDFDMDIYDKINLLTTALVQPKFREELFIQAFGYKGRDYRVVLASIIDEWRDIECKI